MIFRDAEGHGHEWQTWQYALNDFALRLFQAKKRLVRMGKREPG